MCCEYDEVDEEDGKAEVDKEEEHEERHEDEEEGKADETDELDEDEGSDNDREYAVVETVDDANEEVKEHEPLKSEGVCKW